MAKGLLKEDADTGMEPLNLDRYCSRVEILVGSAFAKYNKRLWAPSEESPIRTSLARHAAHPQIEELLAALGNGLPCVEGKLINRISADWSLDFLGVVSRSNTKASYKYLAREAGSNGCEGTAEDLAPLVVDGKHIVR